jgi:phenylalanyl-tRNA synthetase alpha chain
MEGARFWDRRSHNGNITSAAISSLDEIPPNDMRVEDPNPTVNPERNPLQPEHTLEEVEAIATHLKRSLENVVVEIFSQARQAAAKAGDTAASAEEPLKVRWIEAYFPFTSPSWELEIWWQGQWLEVLGCGVTRQSLYTNAGFPDRLGWAFGIGLERIAMLLFNIPDIRLFWSRDERFLGQFRNGGVVRFVPFSKFPECYKDVSFWLPPKMEEKIETTSAAGGGGAIDGVGGEVHSSSLAGSATEAPSNAATTISAPATTEFHENDIMEIVRDIAGDLVEDVRLADEFTHPKTGRRSLCYRINYRSLERTLRNEEVNGLHKRIEEAMVERLGVVIR